MLVPLDEPLNVLGPLCDPLDHRVYQDEETAKEK